ncbi:MAG: PilZ domain-containing protein [Planctomycetota bacterium]
MTTTATAKKKKKRSLPAAAPEQRFKLQGKDCFAALLWFEGETERQQLFRKAAISKNSLKGFLPGEFPVNDSLTVVIFRDVDGQLEQLVTVPADLHNHRRGETEEGNWLNLRFSSPVEESDFAKLSAAGAINRREHERKPVNFAARGRWQLDPAKFDVVILDVSYGGLRLFIEDNVTADIGDLLLLDVSNDHRNIAMELRWKKPVEGGAEVGFKFMNQNTFVQLEQVFGMKRTKAMPAKVKPANFSESPVAMLAMCGAILGSVAWFCVF